MRYRLRTLLILTLGLGVALLTFAAGWAWLEYVAYLKGLPLITPIPVPTPPGV